MNKFFIVSILYKTFPGLRPPETFLTGGAIILFSYLYLICMRGSFVILYNPWSQPFLSLCVSLDRCDPESECVTQCPLPL